MSFSRAANPIWYFVNLTGQQLDDTYYIFFLTNTMPYLPQNVFQDKDGNTPWANPLQFLPNGTLPDNLYFDDDLDYRLEIRQGPLQSDPLIYEINDFIPLGAVPSPEENTVGEDNQISNAQFSEVSFNGTLTITAAGTYEVAPGWSLKLTGSGTTSLIQRIFSANETPPTPPYALEINNNGWTTAQLFQRFNGIGALYDGIDNDGGAIAATITAKAVTTTENIAVSYVPNAGASIPIITSTALSTSVFTILSHAVNNPNSNNNGLSNVDYIDIIITLPNTGIVQISNVQFVGQNKPLTDDPTLPAFQEETLERQQDHLFHYYADNLIIQPKKSLAVGWNFSLNPFQGFTGNIETAASQTQYIADQTILHQEATSQLQTGRAAAVDQRNGLEIIPVTAASTTRFALIQYIDPSSIMPYWSYIVSSLMRARIFNQSVTPNSVRVKMRLIWRNGLPSTIGAAEPITGWDGSSNLIFSAGWTAIVPENDPAYVLPNAYETTSSNAYPAFAFNNMLLPPSNTGSPMTLGIVLYTMDNMNSVSGQKDFIVFDKVSLVPGQFGADAHPQTFDECLRECQFYYENSYELGVLPGTATFTGVSWASTPLIYRTTGPAYTDGVFSLGRTAFTLNYKVTKRATPIVILYNPDTGDPNVVKMGISAGGITNIVGITSNTSGWGNQFISTQRTTFSPTGSSSAAALANYTDNGSYRPLTGDIYYQYSVDARLGT